MEKTEIVIAIVLLFGLLIGILIGWYGTMYFAKKKYIDGEDIVLKRKREVKPQKSAKPPKRKSSEVNLKGIIEKRNIDSYTDFSCETDGENSLEAMQKNREGSNEAYEYLKKQKND